MKPYASIDDPSGKLHVDLYAKDKKFSAKVLFDFDPGYESKITVKGFEPSKAVGIRVGDGSTILTFEEFKMLMLRLMPWLDEGGDDDDTEVRDHG